VDKNRRKMDQEYPHFESFKNNFIVTENIIQELLEYSDNEGFKPDVKELETSKDRIKLFIKAYIARDLWSSSEFYRIVNDNDDKFLKALEVLENWELYNARYLGN
jgi:carboxyl-terminal processing protease